MSKIMHAKFIVGAWYVVCKQGMLAAKSGLEEMACVCVCMCVCVCLCLCACAHSCPTLCDPMDCSPPDSSCPWNFSRQEYWSRPPFPIPGDLPEPGIEPASLVSPALAGGFFTTSTTWGKCTNMLKSIEIEVISHFFLVEYRMLKLYQNTEMNLWETWLSCYWTL